MSTEVRFDDSWFVFHDSSWSFHESYLSRKHVFDKSYRGTEHKIMVLKPANKYQIIWYCHNFENILIDNFWHHSISLLSKSFQISFLQIAKTRQLTIQRFIYYLIYSGVRKVFYKTMLHMFFKEVSIFNTYLINISCFISNLLDLKLKISNLDWHKESYSLHFENNFSHEKPKILFGKNLNFCNIS